MLDGYILKKNGPSYQHQTLSIEMVKVYNRLPPKKAINYERLKIALLVKYDFTKRGYHEKYREARLERHKSLGQFIFKLKIYFTQWIELGEVEQTFINLTNFLVREQFTSSYPKNLSIWLKQSNPRTVDELSQLDNQYMAARNQKLSRKKVIKSDGTRAGVKEIIVDSLLRVPVNASYVIALVTRRLNVVLNQNENAMSITD